MLFLKLRRFAVLALALLPSATVGAMIDLDGDGISDLWERETGVESLNLASDRDGDGFLNGEEITAGTDVFGGHSFPRVGTMERSATQLTLRWAAVGGKWYRLEFRPVGTGASWRWLGPWQRAVGDELTLSLRTDAPTILPGTITAEYWFEVGGSGLSNLYNHGAFQNDLPDSEETLTRFQTESGRWNEYGTRVRGYVIPPTTGSYTFWIASDDSSELYLSSGLAVANRSTGATPIASVSGHTSYEEWNKYGSQQSVAITLQAGTPYYIEAVQKEGWGGDHLSVAWSGPGIAQQVIPGSRLAPYLPGADIIAMQEGPLEYRLQVDDRDADGDGLTDWEELKLGFDPDNAYTVPGPRDDYALAERMLLEANTVRIAVVDAEAYEATGDAGRLYVERTQGLGPLTVSYTILGEATNGVDFEALDGTVTFGLSDTAQPIDIIPIDDFLQEPPENVVISLTTSPDYEIGNTPSGAVTIEDNPPAYYLAQLDPLDPTATGAAGTSFLRLSGNRTTISLNLFFSNLSSPQTAAQIHVEQPGSDPVVHTLPLNQVDEEFWVLTAVGGLTVAEIIAALEDGRLYLTVYTTQFPGGEIRGTYVSVETGNSFVPPPPPPVVDLSSPSVAEASRFLQQATFGPTDAEIARVQSLGYEGWVDEQLSRSPTLHYPLIEGIDGDATDNPQQSDRLDIWWLHSVEAPDQLRQRVAFALSQIMVVSENDATLDGEPEGLANYYDLLLQHAFGNYRDLLEAVTLSPVMGTYLSHLRNDKPDPMQNRRPDENYAREVMQLFSIGLLKLHPDGTLMLDERGWPLNTYTLDDVVGLAHVFTGWSFYNHDGEQHFYWGDRDYIHPMSLYPEHHDTGEKHLLDGHVLPAGRGGRADLRDALDILFHHPNTGPFISRLLIQRLVKSNPSRGYVYRVAQVFADNGSGVRGDLGAVVKAILLDPEGRSLSWAEHYSAGKLKEPVIRVTHLLRAFNASSPGGLYTLRNTDQELQQTPMAAPSVFNFYDPTYIFPGDMARAGVVGPEFQITSEITTLSFISFVEDLTDNGVLWGDRRIELDLSTVAAFGTDHAAMVAYLDRILLGGMLTDGARTLILLTLRDLQSDDPTEVAAAAVQLMATSPEGVHLR